MMDEDRKDMLIKTAGVTKLREEPKSLNVKWIERQKVSKLKQAGVNE